MRAMVVVFLASSFLVAMLVTGACSCGVVGDSLTGPRFVFGKLPLPAVSAKEWRVLVRTKMFGLWMMGLFLK